MTTLPHKTILWLGGLLLGLSIAAGSFFSLPALFFAPPLLLLLYFFIQYPRWLFWTLLASIPWSVEMNVTESLGTDFPDEPLMVLLAFVVLAILVVRSHHTLQKPLLQGLLLLLLLTVAWSAVTVLASTHPWLSMKFFLARGWYLLAFVGAPLVLKGDEKWIRQSAAILTASMFLATCVSLCRHAFMGFSFVSINEAVAPFFRNHVNYSALLVFMVPLQVAFLRLTNKKKSRALLLFSLGITLTALYFSFARGAWLALLVGGVSYALLKKRWLFQSFLVVVFFVTAFVFWLAQNERYLRFAPQHDVTIFHENFGEHLVATYQGNDVSTAERFYRWVAGVRMSGERWATGFGPTTFFQHYKSYAVPAFRTWVSDNREQSTVHNYFLLLLIEQGVVGLLLFLCLLGALFWYAQKIYYRTNSLFWKTTVAAIAAILAMQCTLNFLSDLVETDKVGSVFYLCLSFLLIADAKTKRTAEQTNPTCAGNKERRKA